jgi:hypothetical protein
MLSPKRGITDTVVRDNRKFYLFGYAGEKYSSYSLHAFISLKFLLQKSSSDQWIYTLNYPKYKPNSAQNFRDGTTIDGP